VHHVTYNVIDMPGFLWMLRGVPFVWGPVGGGQVPPPSLRRVFTKSSWLKEHLRATMKSLVNFNPAVRGAAKRAKMVLFANDDTAALLDGLVARGEMMLETAIERDQIICEDREPPGGERFPLLWLANFEQNKALMIALDAIRRAQASTNRRLMLDVVGEGPARKLEEARVQHMGMEAHVSFHGCIPFEDVPATMRRAGAFLFTSVRDTSGNVVLEAMAAGTPVIGLDHQGVKQMLSNGGGLLVDIGSYEQTVEQYAEAIVQLAEDDALWRKLSAEARNTIDTKLNWDAKGNRLEQLYAQLLESEQGSE
jgi:glycosyltransferase involved in cell wall biosynthesis